MLSFIPALVVVASMQAVQPAIIETPEIMLEVTARTPDQMGSFYEARGFPKPMLNILKQQCIMTVGITNKTQDTIWMNLSNWEFTSQGKVIHRKHRNHWKQRWQKMNIPLNKQSTFRWTLIPEILDYLPGEREGGNIVLPFTKGYFSLKAEFATGKNKQGKTLTISTDKLFCAEDAQ
ncbi:hypothetical protein MNBD_GAMMA05-711 [hydrothermal vent metagenome]|uniref:Uncharacterized protein n=1 Tax=hydrothermal vent metagenome TaxID=652676 RepID=A0A3B0WT73_9ZZZZ